MTKYTIKRSRQWGNHTSILNEEEETVVRLEFPVMSNEPTEEERQAMEEAIRDALEKLQKPD